MPRKKTVIPDEDPMEAMSPAETSGEENTGQFPEPGTFSEGTPDSENTGEGGPAEGEIPSDGLPPAGEGVPGEAPYGDVPGGEPLPAGDGAPAGEEPPAVPPADSPAHEDMPSGSDFPMGEESPFPEAGEATEIQQPQEGAETESDDPEYGALLQEFGESIHGEAGAEEPLTLGSPPGEELIGNVLPPEPAGPEEGLDNEASTLPRRPRGRPRRTESATAPAADPRRDRVLTIEARDEVQTPEEREAIIWHEIQNAHWTRRILTGKLDGVERTGSGMTVAVVIYKGFRVAIPVKEMLLFPGRSPSGAEFEALMARMRGILTARLDSEIDFVVRGHDNKNRAVIASRKDAMYRKRQTFYLDRDEQGRPLIYEGRIVQARVVAVAEKVIRVEVFGVECAIVARGLSRAWVGNAADHYHVGDRILVRVQKITGTTVEDLSITADVRSTSTDSDNLNKCVRQGRYAGRVTDVRGGVLYVRLNNGVNAIAHSCYDRRTPGKGDDVSFAVTRLDEDQGVAIGSITRIIKQNL